MEKFKAHILIVDDDDRIRELVKQYLNENNYLVTTANSAEDAKEKVDIIKFDIIILDIMMPGQSGLDFTNENKKKINYEEIDIGYDDKKREEMLKKSNGAKTIPQIFVEDKHIGGYVELKALESKGELDTLLKS